MPDEKPEREFSKLDERVSIPLDPEVALRALLKVNPDERVPQDGSDEDQGDKLSQ